MLNIAYNPFLVGLSMLIASLASYVALDLAGRVTVASGSARRNWILASAAAMGIGIWSMHFVGMLAVRTAVPIAYDIPLVALSVIIAITGSAVTFFMSARERLRARELAVASLFMGPAIAGMHYTGMAAMRMPAHISYDVGLVTLSVVIAIVVSFVALQLAMRLRSDESTRGRRLKAGAAAVMGAAVYGMHYTGMLAARFDHSPGAYEAARWSVLGNETLAAAVAVTTMMVLAIAAVGALADRRIRARTAEAHELRRTTALLRAVIENSPEAIIVTDLDLRVSRWNLAATNLLGWDAAEMVGASLTKVFAQARTDGGVPLSESAGRSGLIRQVEDTYRRKDGSLADVSVSLAVLREADNDANGYVFLITDETERKRLAAQVRQSQKMEAVGQLAGGIAHDFNNVLTVITSYAQFLSSDLDSTDPRCRDVAEIQKAAERAASLTRQLLAFSRQQRIKLEIVDMNEIVRDMREMLRRLIPANIELNLQLADGPLLICADKGQIEQVMLNLVLNARDAIESEGVVGIKTAATRLARSEPAAGDAGVAPGEYAKLSVSDTGSGMTPDVQARMFEPFFTTKQAASGTGLGLSTVYGIVKQSDGSLTVDSSPGKGTTVHATFPVMSPELAIPPEPKAVPRRVSSETILLVEDESSVRAVARRVLEREGYKVLEAATGEEALSLHASRASFIDLVISDMVMPGMTGYALQARLHETEPRLRMLFMSGYSREALDRGHEATREEAFLPKPFTPEMLAAKVREVLEK